ncbi:phosphotransferase [Tsukamurella sp. 8F]|uniref:maltokinase N-terminal cap-like domain-containing protein n=1 Tax=unclassified Tsukamurella TaxID=2633480 RepID=UPI0023BA335D|nr:MULTISPECIES: phosphotransferase [unclassified Tsukamurella]MDF0530992.1 phosphotransferase [Tsukamurella sp. 8J]MDF0588693.1 phosphotransferase [Tsukamurella sp. 8F]
MSVTDAALAAALGRWLPAQRWFSAKTSAVVGTRIAGRQSLPADAGTLEWLLVEVELDGAAGGPGATAAVHLYQVPLLVRDSLPPAAEAAHVPSPDIGTVLTCALTDPDGALALARHVAAGGAAGALRFRTDGDTWAAGVERVHPLGVDQSNSSVVLDGAVLLKVFRRVFPGPNPDVELTGALTRAGSPSVAPLLGSVEWTGAPLTAQPTTLAMAQRFEANAADGWQLALASVRDLMAEGDLLAEEVGSDTAAEMLRLGGAVARMHADLRATLGAAPAPGSGGPDDAGRGRFADLTAGLERAVIVVPQLAGLRERVAAVARAAADEPPGPWEFQRVHGDLHLGQALRTPSGWLLVDFEGEPAAEPAARRAPDHPLRDVAGILRSLDYAGRSPLQDAGPGPSAQLRFRADEWTRRNRDAFCTGYAREAGADPRDTPAALRAFELEKALYEAVYEAQNRPSWIELPLHAIDVLTQGPSQEREW